MSCGATSGSPSAVDTSLPGAAHALQTQVESNAISMACFRRSTLIRGVRACQKLGSLRDLICIAEVDDAHEGELHPSIRASPLCQAVRKAQHSEPATAEHNNPAGQLIKETAVEEDLEALPLNHSSGNAWI